MLEIEENGRLVRMFKIQVIQGKSQPSERGGWKHVKWMLVGNFNSSFCSKSWPITP